MDTRASASASAGCVCFGIRIKTLWDLMCLPTEEADKSVTLKYKDMDMTWMGVWPMAFLWWLCVAVYGTLLALRYFAVSVIVNAQLWQVDLALYGAFAIMFGYEMADFIMLRMNKKRWWPSLCRMICVLAFATSWIWYDIRQGTWGAIVDLTNVYTQALLLTMTFSASVYVLFFVFSPRLVTWYKLPDTSGPTTAEELSQLSTNRG